MISADFEICINVPLSETHKVSYFLYLKTFFKIVSKKLFWVEKNKFCSSTRISTRTTVIFDRCIDINALPDGLTSISKIFADNTSLFSKIFNINESANDLNTDLEKISQWTYQWKMQFNPDPNKQTNEIIFSRKSNANNLIYPPVKLKNINILDVLVKNI